MKVVGIMSGTSMDGVDLCLADLEQSNGNWNYNILASETVPLEEKWRVRLSQLRYQNSEVFAKTDIFFGKYVGELVNQFLEKKGHSADLIASHGHTVFHDPAGWITTQIGDGATINATTGIPVVSNFRRGDVALGGQGAPLVGMGDELLFGSYDICLNLGGFANISAGVNGQRIAFDVAPCNIILNRLARDRGKKYDEGGEIAESGAILYPLLNDLNAIPYYAMKYPKSLGREWINKEFWYIVREFDGETIENRMKTLVMHIAQQIAKAISELKGDNGGGMRVLVTGGGAHNHTLVDYIRSETDASIEVPEDLLVDYKEALVFALLGAMRVKNQVNIQNSATGAGKSIVAGSLDGDFSRINS